MSIREFISTIKNNLNTIPLDTRLSGEYIYFTAMNIASFLIKRETENRKIFKNTSIFYKLPCVELEEVSVVDCNFNISCKTLMRSKKPLPKAFLSNYGSVIQIFNVMRNKDYKEVSITHYKNISSQKNKARNTKYFWIENDYLYIPDSEVEILVVIGLFSNPEEVIAFNEEYCTKLLDFTLPVPDYLLQPVTEMTLKQLSIRLQIPRDEDSNLNSLDKQ